MADTAPDKVPSWQQYAEEEERRRAAIPADLVDIVTTVMEDDAHEHCGEDGCPGNTLEFHESQARQILVDLMPAIETGVRAKVAAEIRALWPDPTGNWRAEQADAARAMKEQILQRIARGDSTLPRPAAPEEEADRA